MWDSFSVLCSSKYLFEVGASTLLPSTIRRFFQAHVTKGSGVCVQQQQQVLVHSFMTTATMMLENHKATWLNCVQYAWHFYNHGNESFFAKREKKIPNKCHVYSHNEHLSYSTLSRLMICGKNIFYVQSTWGFCNYLTFNVSVIFCTHSAKRGKIVLYGKLVW